MPKEEVLETGLIEKEVKPQKLTDSEKTIVRTALDLLTDYEPIRLSKAAQVRKNKAIIEGTIGGLPPTRLTSLPSYLVFNILKLFSTLIDIPDKRLIIADTIEQQTIIMAAFVDQVMREGGYHEALMSGWGGFKDAGLSGNTILAMGLKDNGMPVYHCLPIEAFSFTVMSRKLRTQTGIGETGRYTYSIWLTLQRAEEKYPGILDIALPGELPSSEILENNQELTGEQIAAIRKGEVIQVVQFVDKDFKVKAILAGSNAALVKADVDEDFPLVMDIDGETQEFLDIVKYDFEPLPEGMHAAGIADMFGSLNQMDTDMSSSKANNTLDNNTAAPIVNVPNTEASGIFAQIKMTEDAIKNGKRAYMAFDSDNNNGQALGRATVDYLRNTFDDPANKSTLDDIERRIKRSGWNLDYLFTNPDDTNLQTKLNIEANNQNVIDIQSHNMDFYKMPYLFAIFAITKFGKVNDKFGKMVFGTDLKIETLGGEEITLGDLQAKTKNKPVLRGTVIQWFKDVKKDKKQIVAEVDIKSGVEFNKRLEEDVLLKRQGNLIPGSPEWLKVQSALSMLWGGKELKPEQVQNQGQVAPQGMEEGIQKELEL